MSFFNQIIKILTGSENSTNEIKTEPSVNINREYKDFTNSYRIGILCYFESYESQNIIFNYKQKLEQLGFECDALMFVDKMEKENNVLLPYFNWEDLDKKSKLPHSPKTDRVIVKKYDLMLNLFFNDCKQLKYIAQMSQAKCRVGPNNHNLIPISDILIHNENQNIQTLITSINQILKIKPYERKPI
ncbi:MAG TPA: hypothetical protein PKA54_01945 [Chitinophagaceae bacterium]|nr:MAG: hypothetical protein UZ11_BCD004001213 [Bacteroidetes bacterium OLB11]HMN32115.1 hypothetical protein [Chitinophagaceae bacterium]